MSHTWRVFNTSTMLPVVEADPTSEQTEDEARRAACAWLIAEADSGTMSDEDATLLDEAAQDLNLSRGVSIGGVFSWDVEILLADDVE